MREESLLPLPAGKARVGMGKTKIYEQIKIGAFPACIKNGRTSVWVESEIDAWVTHTITQKRTSAERNHTRATKKPPEGVMREGYAAVFREAVWTKPRC